MRRYFLPVLLAACFLPALAQEPAYVPPAALTPAQEATAITVAETVGLAIFRHDRATAQATDAVRKQFPAFIEDKRMRGWMTQARSNEIVVTFYGDVGDGRIAALYRSIVSFDGEVVGTAEAFASPVPLTEFEQQAVAARTLGMRAKFTPCGRNYNSVVLPNAQGWAVYLIPGTTSLAKLPLGGAYLVDIDQAATTARSTRAFSRSCLTLERDAKAAALMTSHVLDSVPTEVHVFWSLWARMPMAVVTPSNKTIWQIVDGKVKPLKREVEKSQ